MWWLVTLLYLALIYATLSIAPLIWAVFDDFFLGNGMLILYTCFIGIGVWLLHYMISRKKERAVEIYLLFFLLILITYVLNKMAIRPAEKIHLLEYGLLSVLVYNALKIDLNRYGIILYVLGTIFCSLAGFYDEVIQRSLPGRYFSWRDVLVNSASSLLGFVVIRFIVLRKDQNPLQTGADSDRIFWKMSWK